MMSIIENGEDLSISNKLAEQLIEEGVIYQCPDCGADICHTTGNYTLDDVEIYMIDKN